MIAWDIAKRASEDGGLLPSLEGRAGLKHDSWGRQLLYEVREDKFVLYSLGRDGLAVPGFDPWARSQQPAVSNRL